MATFVKSKIKAARDAINKKDYQSACDAAASVLEYEPANYNANVFLGLALSSLGQVERSEQAYRNAITENPEQILAWQGVSKLYETTGQHTKLAETLEHVAQLYAKSNDAVKCAETVQKLIDLQRNEGTPTQLVDALSLLLPDSALYPILSVLSPEEPTDSTTDVVQAIQNGLPVIEEIIAITEREEEDTVKKEVQKRRMRLGAPAPEQIERDVGQEVWGSSQLPKLYAEVMNHPRTSDDLRRLTESKLLRHQQRYLFALPNSDEFHAKKTMVAADLEELINGMILLGIKDELAWVLYIEGKDPPDIEDYELDILRQYTRLFPSTPLTSLLLGYFQYTGMTFDEEEDSTAPVISEDEDPIDNMIAALGILPESLIACRLVAYVYEAEGDYDNAMKVAEAGIERLNRTERNLGKQFPLARKAFNIILATSLVHLFPPKHHARALRIIDDILTADSDNVPCLMARGYVLQHAGKWSEAGVLFDKVMKHIPDDLHHGIRAQEEFGWCQVQSDDLENGAKTLEAVIATLSNLDNLESDKARCWWRLGNCYWNMGDSHREEAYRHFITSLKCSPTFAPAFTSLGIYYSDFLSPPDPNRASKCFQKAFELDPREVEAARRLTDGFAEENEWDLVEVVARRTIKGEGGADTASSARYLPINAWAWKAVGVVELNRHRYAPAIQAFQIALRADPDDYLSWLRLGEAYSRAGHFAASLKTLRHARELNPDDWVCVYFIGDIQRQMGEYQESINAFESILTSQSSELGILISLGQAHLEFGCLQLHTDYTARAEASFISAIRITLQLLHASEGFRSIAWKTAGDAAFQLSSISTFADEGTIRAVLAEVKPLVANHPGGRLSDISYLLKTPHDIENTADFALEIAMATYDYRLSLGASTEAAIGSAWFDLGVSLYRRASKTVSDPKQGGIWEETSHCFKEALRLDPMNDRYWNALADTAFSTDPKIAQHAYIRAVEIDSKNASTWTNLGFFYLHHEDVELAAEAFTKAQTLDPDHALIWLGHALVATMHDHKSEAKALYEHAVGLAVPAPEADLEFATAIFEALNMEKPVSVSSEQMLSAFFVLNRYCKQHSLNPSALHLFGLICERVGHIQLGVDVMTQTISLLEAAYEESEDPIVERQFAIAHANIARLRLAFGDPERALESYQVVLGLLPEEPEDSTTRSLLVQAQFGSGLANFKLGELEDALGHLTAALETASNEVLMRGHVVVLLAQMLWAIGTDESRESAKAHLLQSINSDPENLAAINVLAGMGILTDDESLIDAALSEILSLPLNQRHERDPGGDVTYLLIQHGLAQGDAAQALTVVEKAILAHPSEQQIRLQLASLLLQQGENGAALAMTHGSSGHEDDNTQETAESLRLRGVAACLNGEQHKEEALRLLQKAIMLSPSATTNRTVLAFVRNYSVL